MTGLAYFISEPADAFTSLSLPNYPPLTTDKLHIGCWIQAMYRKARYPLGKSKRGFKKWLKGNFAYQRTVFCKFHEQFEAQWRPK